MTTIGARSIHLVCSLQGLAVLWWEGQAHPRDPDGYHADDFAKWLCETLGLTLWVIQGGLLEPPGAPQLSGCADRDHRP